MQLDAVCAVWWKSKNFELLSEASKNIACGGILQVYDLSVINILRKFCLRETPLQDGNHLKELRLLTAQLPSMWKIINDICIREDTSYPPREVCLLIVSLIRIRNETFRNATQRFQGTPSKKLKILWHSVNHTLPFHPRRITLFYILCMGKLDRIWQFSHWDTTSHNLSCFLFYVLSK